MDKEPNPSERLVEDYDTIFDLYNDDLMEDFKVKFVLLFVMLDYYLQTIVDFDFYYYSVPCKFIISKVNNCNRTLNVSKSSDYNESKFKPSSFSFFSL